MIEVILNKYFKAPVFWDNFISISLTISGYFLTCHGLFTLPRVDRIVGITSDLSNVGMALSGFILTILTLLITFKAGSNVNKSSNTSKHSVFELFFGLDIYIQTVRHFKNGVKVLLFVSISGFILKLLLEESELSLLFFYNIYSITIISLTIWRSILMISKIIKMQEN